MKSIAIFILFAAAAVGVRAQNLRGRIVDSLDRPIAGAAVIALAADSAFIAAAVWDPAGEFAFDSVTPPVRLLVQHLAYSPLAVYCAGCDAGTIRLAEATTDMETVTVVAERPAVTVSDTGISYDLAAATEGMAVGNAFEAVTRLPAVEYRDGRLTLAGAGDVALLVNGRPSTMSAEQIEALLRSMPVDRIERADVMYSAPPQTHIRGAAIDLRLRRGYGRTLAGEVHGDFSSRYYGSWSAGGSVVRTSGDWTLDALYSTGRERSMRRIDMLSLHTLSGETYSIGQLQRLSTDNSVHNVRLAADFAPSDRGHFSAAYTASFKPRAAGRTLSAGDFVHSAGSYDGESSMHNASLRYTSVSGFDVTLDYTRYRTDRLATMENDYASGVRNVFETSSGQTVDRIEAAVDRSHSFAGGWQLFYGAEFDRASDRDRQNYTFAEGSADVVDTDSHLNEYTADAYAGFGRAFSSGSFHFSIVGEYYRSGGYDALSLYPNLSLMWMPASKHIVQLSLTSDKNYPSYWEMQRAVSYIDGYSEIHGTPELHPSKSWQAQALYMYDRRMMLILFWQEMPDYFIQTAYQSSERLALIYRTLNWNVNRQWGASAVVPFRSGRWLDSRLTLTVLRQRNRCDEFHDMSFDRARWIGQVRMDNSLTLSRRPALTLDLSGFYQTAAIQGTYDIRPAWSVDVGLKWSFGKGRADLILKCTDLFDSSLPKTAVRYGGQCLDMDSGAFTRTATLRFSLRFGNWKERKHDEVDTSRFGH